jgi:hypothetical protein
MAITINGTTGIAGVDGSASTPALQGADTNTGMFFPAADTVAVTTGGAERMRVDSSGNVGIGTTSPAVKLDVLGGNARVALSSGSNTTLRGYEIAAATTVVGSLRSNADSGELRLEAGFSGYGGISTFYTNGSERARIDSSGNLLIGTTGISNARLVVYGSSGTAQTVYAPNGSNGIGIQNQSGTATYNGLVFSNNGGSSFVASVQVFASSVAYNTSSDARLKINIQDADSAIDLVNNIQVRKFDWESTGQHQRYGMVAQELQSLFFEVVNDQNDENHTLGIDYSKLVPMLTKAIQEQQAMIDTMKQEIAALKGAQA